MNLAALSLLEPHDADAVASTLQGLAGLGAAKPHTAQWAQMVANTQAKARAAGAAELEKRKKTGLQKMNQMRATHRAQGTTMLTSAMDSAVAVAVANGQPLPAGAERTVAFSTGVPILTAVPAAQMGPAPAVLAPAAQPVTYNTQAFPAPAPAPVQRMSPVPVLRAAPAPVYQYQPAPTYQPAPVYDAAPVTYNTQAFPAPAPVYDAAPAWDDAGNGWETQYDDWGDPAPVYSAAPDAGWGFTGGDDWGGSYDGWEGIEGFSFGSIFKGLANVVKKAAPIALPLAASFIPGAGGAVAAAAASMIPTSGARTSTVQTAPPATQSSAAQNLIGWVSELGTVLLNRAGQVVAQKIGQTWNTLPNPITPPSQPQPAPPAARATSSLAPVALAGIALAIMAMGKGRR